MSIVTLQSKYIISEKLGNKSNIKTNNNNNNNNNDNNNNDNNNKTNYYNKNITNNLR